MYTRGEVCVVVFTYGAVMVGEGTAGQCLWSPVNVSEVLKIP